MTSNKTVPAVILGGGSHASNLKNLLEEAQPGRVVTTLFFEPQETSGGSAATCAEEWPTFIDQGAQWFLGLGDNSLRESAFLALSDCDLHPFNFQHHSAVISQGLTLGGGAFIGAVSYIGPDVSISTGVIVNSGAVVEHDASIGAFCHIGPNATLLGGVQLGRNVLVGAGAVILRGLKISDGAIIGAGSTVTKDLDEPGEVFVGSPAKKI